MSDQVAVAVVSALGLVLVALIGTFGAKINGRLRSVQGQVQNSHQTNLREELDKRHAETQAWFGYLKYRQDETDGRLDMVLRKISENEDRIDDLETTINPKDGS